MVLTMFTAYDNALIIFFLHFLKLLKNFLPLHHHHEHVSKSYRIRKSTFSEYEAY